MEDDKTIKSPQGAAGDAIRDEREERGTWSSSFEFLLSALGYAVGLGNVWRFPYLCYTNGGGAFLIPYFLMLIFVGLPVFFLELSIGQYAGAGPSTIYDKAAPLFKGIGVGMVIISLLGSLYYNMVITWSLYYMWASLTSVLPWDGCGHSYNTINCYSRFQAQPCEQANGTWFNNTCYNATQIRQQNLTAAINESVSNRVAPAEEFFNRYMLDKTDTMEEFGGLKWDLCLTLLLAWLICFLCIFKGIKSSGKVVYFTAIFPYVVLIILFIRGVTLTGAGTGIEYFITPKWEKLKSPKVWGDAAGQIFFSLSVGFGGLMAYSSYNKFNNNVFRDALIVSISNCLTSLFAGFVIFSILGYMAHELQTDIEDVVDSGSGLAFVAYPEVITKFPFPPIWSFLFFFMLLTLGLDSQFADLENVLTAIVDLFPRLRTKKTLVTLCMCICLFLLGLPMCTRAGIFWEEMVGYYSGGWSLVLVALLETVVWAWIYGSKRLLKDIELMIGFHPSMYWWITWTIISPIVITVVLVLNIIDFTPLEYGGYVLPLWAQVLGWLMAFVSVAMVPIFAAVKIVQSYSSDFHGSFCQRVKWLTQPTAQWGPPSSGLPSYGADNLGYSSSRSTLDNTTKL